MKRNIKHAITVGECSMVVEAKNHSYSGWHEGFRIKLMKYNYSIYKLIDTVRNSSNRIPIQGDAFWNEFRRRDNGCILIDQLFYDR